MRKLPAEFLEEFLDLPGIFPGEIPGKKFREEKVSEEVLKNLLEE